MTAFALGPTYGCSVHEDGSVRCWGGYPKAVDGGYSFSDTPVPELVEGVSEAVDIAAGGSFACAALRNGRVSCWGFLPGFPSEGVPVDLGVTDALDVDAGSDLVCVRRANGSVRCFGGTDNYSFDGPGSEPFDVEGVSDAVSLSVGGSRACAVLGDGTARCWGIVDSGDGSGATTPLPASVPLLDEELVPLGGIAEVDVGMGFIEEARICVRLDTGDVLCWPPYLGPSFPEAQSSLGPARAVAVTLGATCAVLDTDGSVRCDGNNERLLAEIEGGGTSFIVDVPELADVAELHLGEGFGCGRVGGALHCWGDNSSGQIGTGAPTGRDERPARVEGVDAAVDLSIGSATCLVSPDGGLQCWGGSSLDPETVRGTTPSVLLEGVAQVAAGSTHSCAVMRDGSVQCWGLTDAGQLGRAPTEVFREGPAPVEGIEDVAEVVVVERTTCGRARDGAVWCWGDNAGGHLGVPQETVQTSASPLRVGGITGAVDLALSSSAACVVRETGAVACWGPDPLGDGSHAASTSPVDIPGLTEIVRVEMDEAVRCVVGAEGYTTCWGPALERTDVPTFRQVTDLSVRLGMACAITGPCGVECFDTTLDGSNTTFRVEGVSDATTIASSARRSCAGGPGGVWCWGARPLGDGVEARSRTPIELAY